MENLCNLSSHVALPFFPPIIQAQRRSSKVERYLKHRRAERPNPQVRSKGCSRRAEMPLNRWNTADDADLDVDEIVARDTCTGCAEISRVGAYRNESKILF